MDLREPAIVCAARLHGETAVIVRLLTERHGLVACYVGGGRGRQLRPVLIPGNLVDADLHWRSEAQLPFGRIELLHSRAPWLAEPLPAAAIGWTTTLTTAALPERHDYPGLFSALSGLLDAICHAPSARGWLPGLLAYEALVLRELGYGETDLAAGVDHAAELARFDALGQRLERYLLADRRGDVMGARGILRARLARIG